MKEELRACAFHIVPDVGMADGALRHNPPGLNILCNLTALIQEIYVAPSAPDWYLETVESVLMKYANFPIQKSSLADPAIL